MRFLCYNGEFLPYDKVPGKIFSRQGTGYVDGLIETMRMQDGRIILASLHLERLFAGLALLKFNKDFSETPLIEKITALAERNNCADSARIRLSIQRDKNQGEDFLVECDPLDPKAYHWNPMGLAIGVFVEATKPCNAFANLKSIHRAPYIKAGLHAVENNFDDCLVLNDYGKIADSTIANVFLILNDKIVTPSLDQGCVAGVMRRYLIEKLRSGNYRLQEGPCSIEDIERADEVFLTNAVRGIQWVRSFKNSVYGHKRTKEIFDQFSQNFQPVSLQNGD